MSTIVYCRVSSKDQVDGTSLESQESGCRAYASKHGLQIVKVFVEQGESAKAANRTQLLELIAFCKSKLNRVEVLLVWKLDRFARNIEDHYFVKATLRTMGVRIVSVTEPLDSDPNGRLMEAILAGFAQFDNDIRSLRTVQGLQQRMREGIFPFMPPVGYLPPRAGKKREPDRIDPAKFPLVQQAWRLFLTGGYSKAAIVRQLQAWGLRGSRGNPISPQRLDHMFANRYYAGVVRDPWTGIEYTGRHVAMITAAEFALTQELVDRHRNSRPHHRANDDFPMRGLVRCPSCGWTLTACWSQGRRLRYPYYLCSQRTCPKRRRSYRAKEIHTEFAVVLADSSVPAAAVEATIDALLNIAAVEGKALVEARTTRRKSAALLERQSRELIGLRTSRLISDDEFREQRKAVQTRLLHLQAAEARDAPCALAADEANALGQLLTDLPTLWSRMSPDQKGRFGRLLFPGGYQFLQSRTAERGLLFRLFGPQSTGDPNVVALTRENTNTIFAEIRTFLAIAGGVPEPKKRAA